MSDKPAARCISEMRDLFLLQVSADQASVVHSSSAPPTLQIEWSAHASESSVPTVVESLIDALSYRYPTVAIAQPNVYFVDHKVKCLEVLATDVEDLPEAPEVSEGEPIPSDSSFPVSINVGDVAFDIASYDGMTYTVLKNGDPVEGNYPTIAAAIGALLEYVLHEVANRESQRGTPNPDQEVDKDFLFELSKFLRNSSIIPDDSVRKYLVDFVELTTRRDFNS